ncbi:MAG: LysM peptidoglycan-binding domain-containing protein [Lacrimispora sp.]|uniref:LysM peptidoglycan-binding domain-containing protein n=1 Tax=Lacrimispora sp. TaxID=2719234 RepID=UPI0039E43736
MIIHVVQPGETIDSISEHYDIPADRLVLENGIINPDNLAVGQTIVIVRPEVLCTVQEGDTLESIAKRHNTTPMELLRNNPYLSDREILYIGETIVISYETDRTKTIATSGYIFPHIEKSVLKKTLPFLTYLAIFNYRATSQGEIISISDDTEIIQTAKEYGVAPMMFVSTITEEGVISREVTYDILTNPSVRDLLIYNALDIMRTKGFYGINIYAETITYDNIDAFSAYLEKAAAIFHAEGFRVVITITPVVNIDTPNVIFDRIDYSKLSRFADAIMFSSYEWARSYSYPSLIFPVNVLKQLLDYSLSIIPPEKLFLGVTTLGYDWTLPYVPGATEAAAITYDSAVRIASENGIPIQYNEAAQAAYFYYEDIDGTLHIVWSKDARSFAARIGLVDEHDLRGVSIWTVMRFDAQIWLITNTQYYIEKVLGVDR